MILMIRSWFGEPEIEFKISHKVYKLIRKLLVENIMQPYGLENQDPELYIGLVITTTKSTENLEVRGPEYDKRNKTVNYGLWLPFDEINNAPNYLEVYLDYLFKALMILFEKYDVPELAITTVQKYVESQVLDNEEYKYSE